MRETIHLLWFAKEMAEGQEDIELLIGAYSSEEEAKSAIDRLKDKSGFADFREGFQICPYELNHDHWIDGFRMQDSKALPCWLGEDSSSSSRRDA